MIEDVNILAVDDKEENIVALRMLLKRPGIRLLEARSGSEALEALLANDIALALVDVNMPEMDGFELAELMRGSERTREVPIIFLTAAVPEGSHVFRGYEAGAVDFLFKPIHPNLLTGKVEVFAQLYRQKRQLARQLEQLRQAQAMSDMFIGVLGHDLRNPLASVVNSAAFLEQRRGDPDDVLRSVHIIQRAASRMDRLTRQVLDFALARVKGGIPIEVAPADLAEIAAQLLADLESVAQGRVSLHATGDPAGQWDADRMVQAVANLLGNALQHGVEGRAIELRVDGTDEQTVRVSVHNEGTIPAEIRDILFSPFKPRGSGTGGIGLGLFIVEQIVSAHRGKVTVSSSDARGTTFEITLPRIAVSWSPAHATAVED